MSMLLAQSLLLLFVLTARDTPQLSTLSLHDALPILRLRGLPPVLEYRTARHHLQVRQLGEAVDDAFRDAVGEVVDIRIRIRVDERQDCYRIYRLGAPRQRIPSKAHCQSHDYYDCGEN